MDYSGVVPPPEGLSVPRHVLEALRRMDKRLDVQWCYQQNRWKVCEWVGGSFNRWMLSFYWTGPNGEFRSIESAEPLLKKLADIDFAKLKDSNWRGAIDGAMDSRRRQFVEDRKKGISEASREHVADMFERSEGIRQTFGPGPLRSRKWESKGSEVLDNFWAERQKEIETMQEGLAAMPVASTNGCA